MDVYHKSLLHKFYSENGGDQRGMRLHSLSTHEDNAFTMCHRITISFISEQTYINIITARIEIIWVT